MHYLWKKTCPKRIKLVAKALEYSRDVSNVVSFGSTNRRDCLFRIRFSFAQ